MKLRFAPVSGAQSSAVRVAAGWFIISGVVLFFFVASALTSLAVGKIRIEQPFQAVSLGLSALVAIGSGFAGWLLLRGRRTGAYLGLLLILSSPAARLVQGQPQQTLDVVFAAVGAAVLLSIWGELT